MIFNTSFFFFFFFLITELNHSSIIFKLQHRLQARTTELAHSIQDLIMTSKGKPLIMYHSIPTSKPFWKKGYSITPIKHKH